MLIFQTTTAKSVLTGHAYMDKTKVLKTNYSLMKVESIALGASCKTFGHVCSDNPF